MGEGIGQLRCFAAAQIKKILSLPASLLLIAIDPIALQPRIGTSTLAIKGHTRRCLQSRELAD
ncbi:hypothetical protein DWF00_04190 [Bosea caraganae]|uniref:Uncharacterized protein n=1 Tax=Bosea caraganae TaxID=2763117 RepID=A0A370KYG7_9HYPH|nr:hypothetical protein DWE98_28675 [Bosea caraganae]RDJ30067.1 hypothetical protein DWF00_04190 [Bosea caraganae]